MLREYVKKERLTATGKVVLTIEEYLLDGKFHRDDGPAKIVTADDCIRHEYFSHGHHHREDGPAEVWINPRTRVTTSALWWKNGERRKASEGPAIVVYDPKTGKVTKEMWAEGPTQLCERPPRSVRSSPRRKPIL